MARAKEQERTPTRCRYKEATKLRRVPACNAGGPGSIPGRCLWQLLQLFLVLAKFNTVLTKKNTVLAKFNTVLAKFNTVLTKKNTAEFSVIFSYSVDSSLGRVPACNAGGPGSIPPTPLLFFALSDNKRDSKIMYFFFTLQLKKTIINIKF